jgi:hypothetical protein
MPVVESDDARVMMRRARTTTDRREEEMNKGMRPTAFFAAMVAMTLPVFSAVPPAYAAPVLPLAAEDGVEPTEKSSLLGLKLPPTALRSTSAENNAQFEEALRKFAENDKQTVTKTEALVWRVQDEPKKKLPALLKQAGYEYKPGLSMEAGELGNVTLFNVKKTGTKTAVLGLWVENKDVTLLAWGTVVPSEGGEPTEEPAAEPTTPTEKPQPVKEILPDEGDTPQPAAAVKGGKAPASLLGKWKWTTISGGSIVDKTTGRIVDGTGGLSVRFSFDKSGRYNYFFYIKKQSRPGWITEATSTHEGTVTFNGSGDSGTLTLHPAKGWYKGSDTVSTKVVDRPMGKEELKPMVFQYEWRTVNGKRTLYIGPSKDSLSIFTPDNG